MEMFTPCNVYITALCSVNTTEARFTLFSALCSLHYPLDTNTYHLIKSPSGSGNVTQNRGPASNSNTENWGINFRQRETCGLEINSTDLLIVRWRWFVVWRRCFSANSKRINVGIARARNQRHHHYRER